MIVFGFCCAVYFVGRLCDGMGAVMDERERMDDDRLFKDCGWPIGYRLKVGGANGIGGADIWVVVFVDGRDLSKNAIELIPVGFLDGATSLVYLSVLRRGHALGICMRVVGMVSVLGLMIESDCFWFLLCGVFCWTIV